MKSFMMAVVFAVVSASAFAQSLSAPTTPSAAKDLPTYTAVGVVKGIELKDGRVVIAHDAVRLLNLPAATTPFRLADKALYEKVAPNRKIEFGLQRQGADLVIVSIKKAS